MEFATNIINQINGIVWGPLMLALLLGVGLYLTIILKFMPIQKIPFAFKMLKKGTHASEKADKGDVTPFGALMTVRPLLAPDRQRRASSRVGEHGTSSAFFDEEEEE